MSHAHIDTSTPEAWARYVLGKVAATTALGLGTCHDGSEYTIRDFLCDTHGGDMPWDETKGIAVEAAMRAHPAHDDIMAAFKAKFGVDFWEGE